MLSQTNLELIFEVVQHTAGGFTASCLNARMADTKGTDLEELHDNLTRAVELHFEEGKRPLAQNIHLMMFQEQLP